MMNMIENAPDLSKYLVCACDVCHRLCSVVAQASSTHWFPTSLHWKQYLTWLWWILQRSQCFLFRFSRATNNTPRNLSSHLTFVKDGGTVHCPRPGIAQNPAWGCASHKSMQIHGFPRYLSTFMMDFPLCFDVFCMFFCGIVAKLLHPMIPTWPKFHHFTGQVWCFWTWQEMRSGRKDLSWCVVP